MSDYTPSIKVEYLSEEGKLYNKVVFKGDLDKAGLAAIKDELDKYLGEFERESVVFDFGDMNFINSEGIGYLLTVYYRLAKANKKFYIVNCSNHVKDVLDVIGMMKIIKCFENEADLENSFSVQT